MAVTSIWAVHRSIKDALDYAANPEKTENPNEEDLRRLMDYAENPDKTEQRYLISGVNCLPELAYERMMETKRRYGKYGGIVAYHVYMSFKTGEVTPEQCHALGVEIAKRLWGDKYEVLVASHRDHEHLHNHFILNKASVAKILSLREYTGDLVNFKTVSKSFKDKTRLRNDEENWAVFKDNYEPIIDRETWEQVQEHIKKTKRRAPKKENGEKNMFCGLLYCADCGHPLWFNVKNNAKAIPFFNCSNYRANRGTCETTHYIRADSLYEIVRCELRRLAEYLKEDEKSFVEILEQKTNKDMIRERKVLENTLQTAIARNNEVSRLYERIYEDNVNGKISDERFMQLSHKYDNEQAELKRQITDIQEQLARLDETKTLKESFIKAVRKFMEMKTLTPEILHELIEKIEVYQIVGTGKSRVQQIVIHYRFVGCIEIPDAPQIVHSLDTRQGVRVSYEAIAV